MKLLQITGLAVCMLSFFSGEAQGTIKNQKSKFTPPEIIQYDTLIKSEEKKDEYKSKRWHQGDEIVSQERNEAAEKPKPITGKKTKRLQKISPHRLLLRQLQYHLSSQIRNKK